MLAISDLIRVARGMHSAAALRRRSPERYDGDLAPVVVWNVCRHCNMTCPHCYAAASKAPSRADLSTDEALRVLEELAKAGVRIVIFSGGEPLLRADLLELIARSRALGMAPQLSSNGVLLDAAMAERLARAGIGYVGVSIDGLATWNDAYRGLLGGFERALHGLSQARAHGMRTGLRVTVTRRNKDAVAQLLELAIERGIDRFYASHLVYAGRGRNLIRDDLSVAETRELLVQLFETAEALVDRNLPLAIVSGGNDSAGPLLLSYLEARHGKSARELVQDTLRERGGNSAGERLLDIDHRGRVHPDQFWTQATLADLRLQSFADALAHPLRTQLANRSDFLKGRCSECRYKSLCGGSHRERALAATGDRWAPDPACVMTDSEIVNEAKVVCDASA